MSDDASGLRRRLAVHHLDLALRLVRLWVQRHMRRHAERLVQVDGGYTDRCVGPHELRRLIGRAAPDQGQRWLDHHGVPPLESLEAGLLDARCALETFSEALPGAQRASLPLSSIQTRFGLDALDADLLLLAAAPRLSEDLLRLMTVAWADFMRRQPTCSFLVEVLEDDARPRSLLLERLSERGALARCRLVIACEAEAWTPLTPQLYAPIAVSQRVIDHLLGAPPSPTPRPGCSVVPVTRTLDALHLDASVCEALVEHLARVAAPRVCLMGPAHSGRRTLAAAALAEREAASTQLLEVQLEQALESRSRDVLITSLLETLREARLRGDALLLRLDAVEEGSALREALVTYAPAVRRVFEGFSGAIFATMTKLDRSLARLLFEPLELNVTPPEAEKQRALWSEALDGVMAPEIAARTGEMLAKNYRLPAGLVFRAVEAARSRQSADEGAPRPMESLDPHHIVEVVRGQLDHRLGWLADLVTTHVALEDVVLPPRQRRQIDEVLRYARHARTVFRDWNFAARSPYGNALSVMFSGPPGTGKTLVAGALARALGRVLYRVDLSRVIDKYIGETEKNLGRVFDEASRAQAVLLFDEADSLFAKRTEVKSSNDRYANLEVNYLLQRLEMYEGVSILTTNFETSIDEAFMRRVRFKITFPMPGPEQRAELWRRLIPPAAPLDDDVTWADLGEAFEMTGGHIRNAVLRAAIEAAARGESMGYASLMRAGAAEARETGALVQGFVTEFDEYDD